MLDPKCGVADDVIAFVLGSRPNINLTEVLIVLTVLIASLSVHEAAHALTADRLGDPTARQLGRLSLNPAVHVDPIGTLLFPLIAIASPACR